MKTEQELIGMRIKNARKKLKLSQEKLCELANLDQSTLSRIESGDGFPSLSNFISILKVLNIEPNFMLDFVGYNKINTDNTLDLLIFEYINKLNSKTKEKILELIKVIQ